MAITLPASCNPVKLLTSLEASRLLDVAPDTIRRRARLGLLPTAAIANGQRLFDRAAVMASRSSHAKDGDHAA